MIINGVDLDEMVYSVGSHLEIHYSSVGLSPILSMLGINKLPLYLMSSADNLCEQFGPRSGPTKCRA